MKLKSQILGIYLFHRSGENSLNFRLLLGLLELAALKGDASCVKEIITVAYMQKDQEMMEAV